VALVYDEHFFDAVIGRIGGQRLTNCYKPPPDSKSADYLVDGFVLELKILELDPLDAIEHQKAIAAHFEKATQLGFIKPVVEGKEYNLGGDGSQQFWRILGKPIRRALQSAEKQVIASMKFIPGEWKSAVLLVNSGAISLDDPYSFFRLVSAYHLQFPGIKAIYAFDAVPTPAVNGHPAVANATISLDEADDRLGRKIEVAIQDEIFARTGFRGVESPLDIKAEGKVVRFRGTSDGLRKA